MRHLDCDWVEFFDALAVYLQLSIPARQQFIIKGPYSSGIRAKELEPSLDEYLTLGIFHSTGDGKVMAVEPRFRPLCKALRAMHRTRIDVEPDAASLDGYLADNFNREEWTALFSRAEYWERERRALYGKISSLTRINDFLRSQKNEWEAQFRFGFEGSETLKPSGREALKQLVRELMEAKRPMPFEEVSARWQDRAALAAAITDGLRYALLFPTLRRDTLEPLLGVWPEIYARLNRSPAKEPKPATPLHRFSAPLVVDAMVAALAASAAEPLRILSGSWSALYQKAERQVIVRLLQLPEWLNGLVSLNDRGRVQSAVSRLQAMHMLTVPEAPSNERHFEITEQGRAWLAKGPKEQVKMLLDRVRAAKRGRSADEERDFITSGTWFHGVKIEVETAAREAYARVPSGAHIRFVDFLDYESREHNPLPKGSGRSGWGSSGRSADQSSEKGIEQSWAQTLARALPTMVDLGALELGVVAEAEKQFLTLSLTSAGKYLLGLAPDFEVASSEEKPAVVVQPNFDIVFTSPSPLAEAELGCFSERHGKHVGVVMKITKKSIWAAAFAGITADRVVETLRRHSSAPIPSNVEREIRGWMAQCKRASVREAMLINCPDEETASRVAAVDRGILTKLSETVVELKNPKDRGRVAKKLREIGVFVSEAGRYDD